MSDRTPAPPDWFSTYVHDGPDWQELTAAVRPQDGEVTLVLGMTESVHRAECRTKGKIKKVVAPQLLESEVADFLRVRRFVACGNCLRDYYVETMR